MTALSTPALELLLEHLAVAERTGRPVRLRPSPAVAQPLSAWPTLPWEAPVIIGERLPSPAWRPASCR